MGKFRKAVTKKKEEDIVVRKATQADAEAIRAFIHTVRLEWRLSFAPGYDKDLDCIQESYKGGALILIQTEKNEILGTFGFAPHSDGTCELKKFYVAPWLRHQGIGSMCMDFLIRVSQSLGYTRIILDSSAKFPEANAWYYRLGFRQVTSPDEIKTHSLIRLSLELPDLSDLTETADDISEFA